MPATPEHKADMTVLVMERRKQGLPVWDRKIDVSPVWKAHDAETPEGFVAMRDGIVAILKASPWYTGSEDVQEIVDELADTDGVDYFDLVWDAIYDRADVDRVWIETVGRSGS